MTQPVLRAKKTVTFAGSTSAPASIPLTSGWNTTYGSATYTPVQNDIVVILYVTASTADRAIGVTTAGYTEEAELYANGSSTDTNFSLNWKRMSGTPDTAVNLSATGNNADAGAVILEVWGGVDTTTAMDVAVTTATGTGAGSKANPPTITPVTADAKILAFGGGTSGVAYSQSGSELSNFLSTFSTDTNTAVIGSGDKSWTGGAFDPVVWAGAGTGVGLSWAAATMALRPAVPGATEAALSAPATGTLTATSQSIASGSFSGAGVGSLSITGAVQASAVFSAAGTASLAAEGRLLSPASLSVSGVATLIADGASIATSELASSGAGSLAAVGDTGTSIASGVLSASGVGSFDSISASVATAALAAAGTSDLVSTGASIATGVLSTAGTASLIAIGESFAAGVLAASGTGLMAVVGEMLPQAAFSAAGTGDFSSTGAAIANAALSGSGIGALAATGATTVTAALASAGIGALAATGATTVTAALASAGIASLQHWGPELIVNGTFDTTVEPWVEDEPGMIALDAGRLKVTVLPGVGYAETVQVLAIEPGLYRITGEQTPSFEDYAMVSFWSPGLQPGPNVSSGVGDPVWFGHYSTFGGSFVDTFTVTIGSPDSEIYLDAGHGFWIEAPDGEYALFDNISLRKLTADAKGQSVASGALAVSGTSSLSGGSITIAVGAFSGSGTGSLTAEGAAGGYASGSLSASGSGAISFVSTMIAEAALSALGTALLSGVGTSVRGGAFAGSGAGAVANDGASLSGATFNSSGAGAFTPAPIVYATGAAISAGFGVLVGVGQSIAQASLVAVGTGGVVGSSSDGNFGQVLIFGRTTLDISSERVVVYLPMRHIATINDVENEAVLPARHIATIDDVENEAALPTRIVVGG